MAFHGRVLRCPLPDAELDAAQVRTAIAASLAVAKTIAQGQRALVTCAMGLNRSALIVALTLGHLTTMDSDQVIAHIRKQRSLSALSNQHFQKIIHRIVGDGRPRASRRQDRSADTEE
jgi:protein-tyrosine phosphatase